MIRSMTGFGEAHHDMSAGRVRVQVKTVNHRFFNASIRLPHGLDRLESSINERLRGSIHRGHVHFALIVERGTETSESPLPELDLTRARRYKELLEALRGELDLEEAVRLSDLTRFSELFRPPSQESLVKEEMSEERVAELTDRALEELLDTRSREGERLAADMRERLDAISRLSGDVAELSPVRLLRERDRLRAHIAELSEQTEVDEDRLAREVAYLAEKWDLNEEVVRLASHVKMFNETLTEGGDQGVGKRLSFVLQEMNREANTIASKANDADIAKLAVGLKEEVERLREQVENVE